MATKKKQVQKVKKAVATKGRKDGPISNKEDRLLSDEIVNEEEEEEEDQDEDVIDEQEENNKLEEIDTSIGPDIEELSEEEIKEINAEDVVKYNTKTRDSYLKNKLVVPQNLDQQEKSFLSQIDLKQGDITRTVTKICRVKAVDQFDKQKKRKEFIYYYENWYGKDWSGNEISPVTDHLEGIYQEQQVKNVIRQNRIVGKQRTGQVSVYYIPFTKSNVENIVKNSKGSDEETIIFNFSSGPLGYEFPYDTFINSSYDDLARMLVMPGGPKLELAKREIAAEEKDAKNKDDKEDNKTDIQKRDEEVAKILDQKARDKIEDSNEKIDKELKDIMESDAEAMDEMDKQKKELEKSEPDNDTPVAFKADKVV